MPSVATALDVARLYEELRDCVRANDQDGVKRIFAELVRARRPVSEILGEVRSLSKERERPERQQSEVVRREWPVQTALSRDEPSAPGETFRNLESGIDSSVAPTAPVALDTTTSQGSEKAHSLFEDAARNQPSVGFPEGVPGAAFNSPSESPASSFAPDHSEFPAAPAQSSSQDVVPSFIEQPLNTVPFATDQNTSESSRQNWEHQNSEPPIGSEFAVESTVPPVFMEWKGPGSAQPVERPSQPATPPLLEEAMRAPDAQGAASAGSSTETISAAPSYETDPITPPPDQTEPRTAPAPSEDGAPEAATQLSSRAASFGVALDAAPATIDSAPPARRLPIVRIVIGVFALPAIASVGWLLLPQKAGEQLAVNLAPRPEATVPAAENKPPRLMARPEAVAPGLEAKPVASGASAKPPDPATPPPAGAFERTPVNTAAPAPAAIAVAPAPAAATAPAAGTAVPNAPAAPRSDAAPSIAKLEPPKDTPPALVVPDGRLQPSSPPASNPSGAVPPQANATAETAALLSRGDALFGVGDVASARLFYERAADAGNGEAALRLGETYDRNFLERAKLRAVQGDLKAAVHWYRRARELGVVEAEILLKGIQPK